MLDRILYVDLETTGVDKDRNGIIQIAAIYEMQGKEIERFSSYVRPHFEDVINDEALQAINLSREEIFQFPEAVPVATKFTDFLCRYINPFDKNDKVYFCGHVASFDYDFLYRFMRRFTRFSLGNFCWGYKIDTFALASYLKAIGKLPNIENLRLGTLTRYFGLKHLNHHNAESDIDAARELFKILHKLLSGGDVT